MFSFVRGGLVINTLVTLFAWCASFLLSVTNAAATRPNIILINADDVGIGDIRATGGPFTTPNIDALAQGGTRFQFCYAVPLCSPSRSQALTGRYPFRTGVNNVLSNFRISPSSEVMSSTVLKAAGYATASVGKWHLPRVPQAWGFDEQLVAITGGYTRAQAATYNVNGATVDLPEGAYLPDIMHDFAVDFIRRKQGQPFFLYYPMLHIHSPILPTPDSQPGADYATIYADNVAYMDKLVGRLMSELDNLNLRERTVVIFTGDNGTANGFPPNKNVPTVDGRPLAGDSKGQLTEGGSRVPLIVNWPGSTPAGAVNQNLIDFSDFFATFAELGGAPLPEGVTLDSRSFAPQILGQPGTPRDWVYVELVGKSYARGARYKLTNKGVLVDMADSPWTELPVPADTQEQSAIDARAALQAVLDTHPAIQPVGVNSDFDGDGYPDLLSQNAATGERFIWFMSPFKAEPWAFIVDPITNLSVPWSGWVSLGVVDPAERIAGTGDFNGDGKPDIIWENTVTGKRIIWFMDSGDMLYVSGPTRIGTATLSAVGAAGTNWKIAGISDFNGDGKPDIVWQNIATGRRMIWFMNGVVHTSTAILSNVGVAGTSWQIVGVGDFNSDGKPDLVWQHTNNGRRIVQFMDGATSTGSEILVLSGVAWPDWKVGKIGDFNADGKPDIVFQNSITGAVTTWFMNGTTRGIRVPMARVPPGLGELCK